MSVKIGLVTGQDYVVEGSAGEVVSKLMGDPHTMFTIKGGNEE